MGGILRFLFVIIVMIILIPTVAPRNVPNHDQRDSLTNHYDDKCENKTHICHSNTCEDKVNCLLNNTCIECQKNDVEDEKKIQEEKHHRHHPVHAEKKAKKYKKKSRTTIKEVAVKRLSTLEQNKGSTMPDLYKERIHSVGHVCFTDDVCMDSMNQIKEYIGCGVKCSKLNSMEDNNKESLVIDIYKDKPKSLNNLCYVDDDCYNLLGFIRDQRKCTFKCTHIFGF